MHIHFEDINKYIFSKLLTKLLIKTQIHASKVLCKCK